VALASSRVAAVVEDGVVGGARAGGGEIAEMFSAHLIFGGGVCWPKADILKNGGKSSACCC
jgi:hypothetical protein